ncbi:hypothetical protein GW17_00022608 [Ensete ventricosum]|nr:hypothetical protein GW17_00022608 [Ensete ventricosum]
MSTPTPRCAGYRSDRGRYYGGYSRDDYGGGGGSGYLRSPRRSPYWGGGRDYSPRRSPYGGRSRRERSRSPYYVYRSPERAAGYGRHPNGYGR